MAGPKVSIYKEVPLYTAVHVVHVSFVHPTNRRWPYTGQCPVVTDLSRTLPSSSLRFEEDWAYQKLPVRVSTPSGTWQKSSGRSQKLSLDYKRIALEENCNYYDNVFLNSKVVMTAMAHWWIKWYCVLKCRYILDQWVCSYLLKC